MSKQVFFFVGSNSLKPIHFNSFKFLRLWILSVWLGFQHETLSVWFEFSSPLRSHNSRSEAEYFMVLTYSPGAVRVNVFILYAWMAIPLCACDVPLWLLILIYTSRINILHALFLVSDTYVAKHALLKLAYAIFGIVCVALRHIQIECRIDKGGTITQGNMIRSYCFVCVIV